MTDLFFLFFSGLITGLLLSAPIGPANIICLERSLRSGASSGFIAGSGAALGDFVYVIMTLIGILAIGSIQELSGGLIKYLSILILVIFSMISFIKGFQIYRQNTNNRTLYDTYHKNSDDISDAAKKKQSIFSGFLSSFVLTVTNPLTPIGVFSAVSAVGLGGNMLDPSDGYLPSIIFLSGIISGALGWWFSLSRIASLFSKKLTVHSLCVVNYFGSLIMLVTAGYLMINI